jgi:hypothetical protein
MAFGSTLLVLDEVHHVAERKAWGRAVSRIVGSPETEEGLHAAGVLNMTGTLFRSSGAHKISTVRYQRIVEDGIERFQAVADYSVSASTLIGVELRPPDLYAYDGQVELVDLRSETVITGGIADLDAGSQMSTAIRSAFLQRNRVHDFACAAIKLLNQQRATIAGREPLKILWVADGQRAAELAAEEINKAAGRDFARLVISDNRDALSTLRSAAQEPNPCAIVAVRMVTEGFDCPQVSVIAYASATTAILFVAQTMARAMRVTDTERSDRSLLPAQILIPNNPALRAAFAEALVGHFHVLDVVDEVEPVGEGQGGTDGGLLRMPRYQLADLSKLDLYSATVLEEPEGQVMAAELEAALAICGELSIPEPYAARLVVATRKLRPTLPVYTELPRTPSGQQRRRADPRTINLARRTRIATLSRWMSQHCTHDPSFDDVGAFQRQANLAAGLPPSGGRDHATAEQLAAVEEWMLGQVRWHSVAHGCQLPLTVRETGDE